MKGSFALSSPRLGGALDLGAGAGITHARVLVNPLRKRAGVLNNMFSSRTKKINVERMHDDAVVSLSR